MVCSLFRSRDDGGGVSIYEYQESEWYTSANITFSGGYSFSMSEDGQTIGIIGRVGNLNPSSLLSVIRYNGTEWVELDTLLTETDEFVCAFSDDGSTLCCGRQYEGLFAFDGDDVGTVTIYRLQPEEI